MSQPWFHVDGAHGHSSGPVQLDPLEVRHAVGARRLRDGDPVVLFDGRGGMADAVLGQRGRVAEPVGPWRQVAAPMPRVAIASAIPKGDRSASMIDMATQLGMAEFVPLRCERSVVEATPNLLQRLARVALEACKQSRRPHVPRIGAEVSVQEIVRRAGDGERTLVADPAGDPVGRCAVGDAVTVVVGPEGGCTPAELDVFREAGCGLVSLGDGVLRVETAVVAAVAGVRGWGGGLRTQDSGLRTQDLGLRTQDSGLRT